MKQMLQTFPWNTTANITSNELDPIERVHSHHVNFIIPISPCANHMQCMLNYILLLLILLLLWCIILTSILLQ